MIEEWRSGLLIHSKCSSIFIMTLWKEEGDRRNRRVKIIREKNMRREMRMKRKIMKVITNTMDTIITTNVDLLSLDGSVSNYRIRKQIHSINMT